MKHGFILIELIVVTLISSMVGGILLTALSQGSRFQLAVDNIIDTSLRIGILSNQLEKDFMGAFIPVQAELSKSNEQESFRESAEKNKETHADDKKLDAQSTVKKGETKEKPQPLEKIFYGTHKEGNLDQLTFVTNNPLVVFVGKDVGIVKPKIVRVCYTLKPELDNDNSYALYRQETVELENAQLKNAKSYEIISGIKSLSVVYTARIEKKQEAPKESGAQVASKEKPKISYEYKTSKDWVSERKKEADKKEEFPRIPYSIECTIVLWDRQYKQEKEFVMVSEIPTHFTPEKQVEPEKQPEPVKKDGAKTGAEKQSPEAMSNVYGGHTEDKTLVKIVDSLTKTVKNLTKMFG